MASLSGPVKSVYVRTSKGSADVFSLKLVESGLLRLSRDRTAPMRRLFTGPNSVYKFDN